MGRGRPGGAGGERECVTKQLTSNCRSLWTRSLGTSTRVMPETTAGVATATTARRAAAFMVPVNFILFTGLLGRFLILCSLSIVPMYCTRCKFASAALALPGSLILSAPAWRHSHVPAGRNLELSLNLIKSEIGAIDGHH